MADYQISIGRRLKKHGFHVEWDPVTFRRLPNGVKNPRGIKVATDRHDGRIGVVDSGSDPGPALEFVRSLGYELLRHEDGFIEVVPSEPGWSPGLASGPSATFSEGVWRDMADGPTAPVAGSETNGSSTDRGDADGAGAADSEPTAPDGSVQSLSSYQRGLDLMREVYSGDVTAPPEGVMDFADVMVRSLFAEVWDRDVMSIRDRRLLILAATVGASPDAWKAHAKAALKKGELSPAELRETLIVLAPYCGYPKVVDLIPMCEELIASVESARSH